MGPILITGGSGRHRPVIPVRLWGAAFGTYHRGEHLTPERAAGRLTFGQFLASRFGPGMG